MIITVSYYISKNIAFTVSFNNDFANTTSEKLNENAF